MKSLRSKVIVPLLLIVVISILSSLFSISSIRRLGAAGDEIVTKDIPVIISLDAIAANIQEMQQLLLNYSIMNTFGTIENQRATYYEYKGGEEGR